MALADMAIDGVEKKVNAFPPDISGAYTLKGDILMLQGKPKPAQALWQKVIELPIKANFWTQQARVHLAGSATPQSRGLPEELEQAAGTTSALLQEGPGAARAH